MSEHTVPKPDYELEALFGKDAKQVNGEWCFNRYINGESIEAMAEEFGVEAEMLRKWIKKAVGLARYKEGVNLAKEARDILRYGELNRIVSLNRKKTLELLESNAIDKPDDLCRIEKTFGDRLALETGKPTERTEDVNRPMTVEELEIYLQKVKDAGTGLDKQSIQS